MKDSRVAIHWAKSSGGKSLLIASLVGLLICAFGLRVHAETSALSNEDQACLKCHDKEGLAVTLESGDKVSLQISTQGYVDSKHGGTSCEDCHADIDAKNHGKKSAFKSKRDLSLSMLESCKTCHKKKSKEYDDGIHATLIRDGSSKAPTCSDCHNPHTLLSTKLVRPISDTPCAKCHVEIFEAYSQDVHGLKRSAKGRTAPICADCHQAHDVKAASLGERGNDACQTCHQDAVNTHKIWLPNAERHFDAISCPVCHAPTAQRRVNLRLFDGAGKQQLTEKRGVPLFTRRTLDADETKMGLDERALWSLLKEFNQDGGNGKTSLRGRLEVRSGVEAHQLSNKSKAIKDCAVCHEAGAEAFQSVILTIAGPDGRPLRHGIQKDVLNSLTSMESVRGFYAIGSTRIKLLDTLLVLVVLASLGGPILHMTIRWYFRRAREKNATK